ncbi:hypothetical protein VPH35_103148 [Triticum aestivum]
MDNMLPEILIRVPLDPSSLPRASLACTRWRHHVTDLGFRRRFRLHHRHKPPLHGFFDGCGSLDFLPALDAPDRVAPECFSLKLDEGDIVCRPLGCRHGLVLIIAPKHVQVLVWEPFTSEQHRLDVPPGLMTNGWDERLINRAVLRVAARDAKHFQVVLVAADGVVENQRAVACVYSSKTGAWERFITTCVLTFGFSLFPRFSTSIYMDHVVFAGDSLYWQLIGNFQGILQFDLERQRLSVMPVSVPIYSKGNCFRVMRAEGGGGIGFLLMSNSNYIAQLWSRRTDAHGVASWVIGRSIELDKLLSLRSGKQNIRIIGFAEDNNVVLITTRKMLIHRILAVAPVWAPMLLVFTKTSIGGGHDGADLLHNT